LYGWLYAHDDQLVVAPLRAATFVTRVPTLAAVRNPGGRFHASTDREPRPFSQGGPVSTLTAATTARRLSGFKPTGRLQLGNYFGAIRPMLDAQQAIDSVVMIVDLHALTKEHDPIRLRAVTSELLATLLAAGVDPERSLCYVQSDVPEHAELHYLLECATGYGEAARMIQFREERRRGAGHVRLSLLTYPVLMAADILLHDSDEVPVGEDQTQHVELARDVANRFNTRYGRTFVVPRAVKPDVAARVMDLLDPISTMGKSSTADAGVVHLLDEPESVRRKVSRAVTDPQPDVVYDPVRRPGSSNLIEILAACERDRPDAVASRFRSYGELKQAVAESVIATLAPIRARYLELMADPGHIDRVRRAGAAQARDRAAATVTRAKRAIGLM
jgi:tryptophanyl-tRNA synthetase